MGTGVAKSTHNIGFWADELMLSWLETLRYRLIAGSQGPGNFTHGHDQSPVNHHNTEATTTKW